MAEERLFGEMKNTLPLIVAAAIAALATALVWHRMNRAEKQIPASEPVWVVRTGHTLQVGDVVSEANAMRVERVSSALPRQCFRGEASPLGARVVRAVLEEDYILRDALTNKAEALEPEALGNCLTTVTFSDPTVGRLLKRGTVITVVGLEAREQVQQVQQGPRDMNAQEAVPTVTRTTYTLRPVLANIPVREVINGGSGVLVELSPADAQAVLWAQRTMELYPWIVKDGATFKPEVVTAEELERRLRALR
ncbi:MAG: hypothetical protein ACI4YA_05160 [Candidatus Spyradenecus sp.]